MVSVRSAAIALFAASVTAQKLQPWDQKNFGYSGAQSDFNVSTYYEVNLEPWPRVSLLFNHLRTYSGLYVQSSGDFVTDYEVNAHGVGGAIVASYKVCGAKGNFTYVPFINSEGTTGVLTNTIMLDARASKNGAKTARINEIYPIYPGDVVFSPNNTSPCL
ncbi:uncharacterized protein CTRU02_208694 [Colletotrichum truncatum]|uniref:Uncharacterized protein n=1 Tax=Colletotrichum truncatum TaxID=5467 RepID=A0ACC3YX18_COLTU|nr:uncharacterized protein CTRU02_06647 [Colletotrichum truncatum]KAF6792564.1 hypothetical protein CTRU02_06647 [Colletotrichum truncatum]